MHRTKIEGNAKYCEIQKIITKKSVLAIISEYSIDQEPIYSKIRKFMFSPSWPKE